MDKINGAGHVGRKFVTEDAGTNRPPTEITADWLNAVQGELVAVIEGAGLVLSSLDNTQLRQAIAKMIQSGQRAVIINNATFAPAVAGTGKAVYWDAANSRFDLARADGSAKQNMVGFADVPNGNVYAFGSAVIFVGLTPGRYYLDGTTAGAITAAVPAVNAILVGVAKSATEMFVDIDAVPAAAGAAIQGAFRNLKMSAAGLAASVSVSCDELVLGDGTGGYAVERNIAGTITTTATGAGGLDSGVLAASTWYYVFRIGKTDGTRAFLFSLSATAPTMPAGYTLWARIGSFRTDATNKYPLAFTQAGRSVQYVVSAGSNVPATPIMASGSAGSFSTPTFVAVGVGAFVPPTASRIRLTYTSSNNLGGIVAPNPSYGGGYSLTNPPFYFTGSAGGTAGAIDMALESANIYWTSTGAALAANGWEDNL